MQIDERVVDGVTILDLKGKMTLGEGDELLKDKINSLIQQDKKQLLLNLEGVPYIDSAGLGEIVRTYTTVSRQGGKLKLLNLTKRIQDLLAITKLLTVFETYDSEPDAHQELQVSPAHGPPRAQLAHGAQHITGHHRTSRAAARDRSASRAAAGARASLVSLRPSQWTKNLIVFAALLFGQRLAAILDPRAIARARRRSRSSARSPASSTCQRRRRPRGGSAASAQAAPADRVGRAAGAGWRSARRVGARRRRRSAAAFWLRPAFGVRRARPTSALLALYSGPLKHIVIIDVLTIAIGFVLRAVGRRGRDRRADQPLAADPDDPAGAVPRAQQAAARAGAARRRRDRPPARSSRNTARTCSTR